MNKKLVLESGEVFLGKGFGSNESVEAEIILNTDMIGYENALSNPSYKDQMVCFSYPLVGNYGLDTNDFKDSVPTLKAMIVKEICDFPSNFRAEQNIEDFCKSHQIVGLYDIDTRKLVKILRKNQGKIKGKIVDA